MNNIYKLGLMPLMAITLLLSCGTESEPIDPVVGSWEWSSGSRDISPQGFDRLHRDRSETYLVGDAEFTYDFNTDGTFESMYNIPGRPDEMFLGTWREENNTLLLNYTQPADWTGISEYRIPFIDDANLDLQWSVQYQEFTDEQVETFKADGTLETWTTEEKESLLTNVGTTITSEITLHFVKVIK